MHDRRDLAHRVDRAGVHVSGLRADDDRTGERGQYATQLRGAHAALLIRRHLLQSFAEAEHPQRRIDRDVSLCAEDHVHRRRSDQPFFLDVPPCASQHGMTRRRERCEVRHLAAGDESHAGRARKIEELEQPFTRDFLDHRHGRRGDEDPAVLIPGTGQPIGGQRDGERTADDESEVARTGASRDSAVRAAYKHR